MRQNLPILFFLYVKPSIQLRIQSVDNIKAKKKKNTEISNQRTLHAQSQLQ